MDCQNTFNKLLVRLGFLPSFSVHTTKDAETENLVVERERTISELNEQANTFAAVAAVVQKQVESSKDDIERVLDHLKSVSQTAADARSILETIIAKRERGNK
jgi:hypothetical protein